MSRKRGFDYIGLLAKEEAQEYVGDLAKAAVDPKFQGWTEQEMKIMALQGNSPEVKRTSKGLYIPAAMSTCGANSMTWVHFLALAIFIACLVAVQYGVQQYRQKKLTGGR